jgi:erythronate-4-phosphate dehydrogenase
LTGSDIFLPLEQVLAESDVVTVHVPLDKSGPDATYRMVDEEFIGRMKAGAMLINTSRGAVVDEGHLKARRRRLGGVVLDVWENEPAIDLDTLAAADIATPHIAGYSYDGKLSGTQMVYDAASAFFFAEAPWSVEPHLQHENADPVDLSRSTDPVSDAVAAAYPIVRDTQAMGALAKLGDGKRGQRFDALRREYPKRLEFRHHPLHCPDARPEVLRKLRVLGFPVDEEGATGTR